MIDRSFGDYGKTMRAPDIRLGDVRTTIIADRPPFDHKIDDRNRSVFVYSRRGTFILEVEGAQRPVLTISQGTAIGFETGRPQRWRAPSAEAAGVGADQSVELFISSIPRRMGILQQMTDGMLIVGPNEEPYASVLRNTMEIHICEFQNPTLDDDNGIIRRCAEIVMIQFVRYVRSKIAEQRNVPAGLAHDEHLLRAWTAFFANPRHRWTVQSLAKAAGLGRTTFAERFSRVFGSPPLQTLTELRLEQAESMLAQTKAPLIEIAFTVGYNSEAAFVRAFHRKYGIPPGRFRAEHEKS